jgi:hypothetical protein
MKKIEEYVPLIEDGIPIPKRIRTVYTRKIVGERYVNPIL